MIELSRLNYQEIKKENQRAAGWIFGVLGSDSCNNSRQDIMVINLVGEGALWVYSSYGNIENGV